MIPTPEVFMHKLTPEDDFVILASDGIFDGLSNEEVVKTAFEVIKHYDGGGDWGEEEDTIDKLLDEVVQAIMKKSLINKSEDNITLILVFFQGFLDHLKRNLKLIH